MDTGKLITGIILCIISILLGVILTYYTYKFYGWKDQIIYYKRRGNIVIYYSICCNILLFIGYPFIFLIEFESHLLPSKNTSSHTFLTTVNDLCFNPFYYFVLFLCLARYWLIFYDIQFSNSCSNLEWKQCINADIELLISEKWYVQHRRKYGNAKYILKRTYLIASLISMISLTFVYIYEFGLTDWRFWHGLNGGLFASFVVFMFCLNRKMPRFNDNIYLKKESRNICFWWTIAAIVYGSCVFFEAVTSKHIVARFLVQLSGLCGAFITPFISTFWVLKQIKEAQRTRGISHVDDLDAFGEEIESPRRSLRLILSDEDAFKLYMQHIIGEMCMESLLALIEFTQFKQYLVESFELDPEDKDCDIGEEIYAQFPDCVPKSDIVYTNDIEHEMEDKSKLVVSFRKKAYGLYYKYVKVGSEFEINISYRMRMTLDSLMKDYEKWMSDDNYINEMDMVKMWDDPMTALIKLLNSSKHRFRYESNADHRFKNPMTFITSNITSTSLPLHNKTKSSSNSEIVVIDGIEMS